MQEGIEHMKDGCQRLAKEAKKYCEQISKMAEVNDAFAQVIWEFSVDGSEGKGELSGEPCSCLEVGEFKCGQVNKHDFQTHFSWLLLNLLFFCCILRDHCNVSAIDTTKGCENNKSMCTLS